MRPGRQLISNGQSPRPSTATQSRSKNSKGIIQSGTWPCLSIAMQSHLGQVHVITAPKRNRSTTPPPLALGARRPDRGWLGPTKFGAPGSLPPTSCPWHFRCHLFVDPRRRFMVGPFSEFVFQPSSWSVLDLPSSRTFKNHTPSKAVCGRMLPMNMSAKHSCVFD